MSFPFQIPIGEWISLAVVWMTDNWRTFFDAVASFIDGLMTQINAFFNSIPWPVMIAAAMVVAWRVSGIRIAVFAGFSFFLVGLLNLWSEGMSTLALMTTAVFISIFIGLPVGILAAKSDRFHMVLLPMLDGMQTIPAFVYLIPAIMFFGVGNVPGIIATVIFAVPPMVRLTNLGIRQVDPQLIESGVAFGSTSWQILLKIQLPLAIPSIMTGVNQTVMMALSMTVIAAMIGAGGLGYQIMYGNQRVQLDVGVDAGLAILLIAMAIDRILQGTRKKRRGPE